MFGVVAVHYLAVAGHKLLHVKGLGNGCVVFVRCKIHRIALVSPVACGQGVVMERYATGVQLAEIFHNSLCPAVVVGVGAAGDLEQLIARKILAEALITAVFVNIIFGAHTSAAAPVLVADAKIFQLPGLFPAVLSAQICHWGNAVKGDVLYPFGKLADSSAAKIARKIRLTAYLLAHIEKFVSAEGIVLGNAAPVGVYHFLAGTFFADAVLPVIFVRKATAGPAENRHFYLLESLDNVPAHAVYVGDRRVLAHINAVVDTSSQMLGKMTVYLGIDVSFFVLCVD